MGKQLDLVYGRKFVRLVLRSIVQRPRNPLILVRQMKQLLEDANSFGYLGWPSRVADYIRRRDVLDVGCGRGLHAVGFAFFGAKSYTGLDPTIDLDAHTMKDSTGTRGVFKDTQWTLNKASHLLPSVSFVKGQTQSFAAKRQFDAVVMHNVTEHLMKIEEDIALFHGLLRKGGLIIFHHPNYYAWGGHHMRPRTLAEIDPDDSNQARYIDWGHVHPQSDWPATIMERQNRIRPGELRALIERWFEIERWEVKRSNTNQGIARLTQEVLSRLDGQFTEDELATQSIICVARRREI